MSWSISSAIAERSVVSLVSLPACTSSARARCAALLMLPSVVSVMPVHACASFTVRSYCCVPSRSFERESALLVANGSSEGFVSSLPEDSFSCVCESRLETS